MTMDNGYREHLDKITKNARAPLIDKLEKVGEVNDELLSALILIDYAIPPMWGDKCVDGVVNIDLSSDAIEAVQSAIKFAKEQIR